MARSALVQPFVSTSIWNTPIASTGVSYVAANLTPAPSQCIRGSPIAVFMGPLASSMDIQKAVGGTSGGGG